MHQSNRARAGALAAGTRGSWLGAVALFLGLAAGNTCAAPPLPDQADDLHLGVVSCAGSTCHGAPETLRDSNVLNTEFVIWNREDKHAKAYKVLLEKDGQRIARNLGLPLWREGMTPEQEDAFHEEWKECLVCHADYVPVERRGKRHQMADGVGCEACHGGGGRYLGPHVSGIATHEENVENGMYPTELPGERAKLCLSCHLGTNNKFATHRIMGAGHPRLSFELDTFTQLEPPHFRIDDDYRERKAVYSGVQMWAVGQITATRDFLQLFVDGPWKGSGMMPELSFFDCHACHHPMKDPRWNPRKTTGLGPGVVRLNDANMLMLLHLAGRLDADTAKGLHSGLLALHKASQEGMEQARAAAKSMEPMIAKLEAQVLARSFGAADMRAMLDSLLTDGVGGEFQDYGGAEQAVMAMHSILDALKAAGDLDAARAARVKETLKRLYEVLKDENTYRPERLVAELGTLKTDLQ
jgi:hypothetical protein